MTTALDPTRAEVRVEFGLARAEVAARTATIAHAEQLAAIDATLREARAFPEVYLGTALPADHPEAVQFAERAAIADLAVRLCVAESTVRAHAAQAATLLHRAPRVWAHFRAGEIAAPNARVVADLIATLPEAARADFEAALLAPAATLAPARFRALARAAFERLQPAPERRHELRTAFRRVHLDHDVDGMSWFSAYLPAAVGERAMARIESSARSLAAAADESRTLDQLRADVAGDLLAGVLGTGTAVGVSVAVTVPVLTLLGASEAPATLEGYGPIDARSARELAGHAPSFTRILTHPITGAVLDIDRTSYRVPADLKRWLEVRDGHRCTFAGCGRHARDCDLDHTIDWADGGPTSAANLAHLCRNHHRLKHNTGWTVGNDDGRLTWRSPTGATRTADPPPF
jgi:hypothetical protein